MSKELFFKGKHLLFIDTYSEYNLAIKSSFERQGGSVDFIYSKTQNFIQQLISKFYKDKTKTDFTNRCIKFLNANRKKQFDFILIKSPFMLNHKFYEVLHGLYPNVKKVNYNWSSIKMYDYTPFSIYFDRVITFDYKDAKNKGFIYFPLFFVDEFKKNGLENNSNDIRYDITTVAHAYTVGRYEFLSKFRNFICSKGLNVYYYLYAPWISFVKARLKGTFIPDTYSKYLSLKQVAEIIAKSKAVVDCQMTIQDGLTMRTFETLGSGRKLITTNENIRKEVFYNSKDIYLVNQDGSNLNKNLLDFINNNDKVDSTKYSDYYIDNWLKKILLEL